MARRKGWDDLSPTYRKRLQRQGVSRALYEAGHDLRAARGKGRQVAEQRDRGALPRGRVGWDNLTDATKRRYTNAGLGRMQYEAGAPLPGGTGPMRFAVSPPMPPTTVEQLDAVGGVWAAEYHNGTIDDTVAWSFAMAGMPPPSEWVEAELALTDGDRDNVFVVHDTRGREWRVAVVAGNPSFGTIDFAALMGTPTTIHSPGPGRQPGQGQPDDEPEVA